MQRRTGIDRTGAGSGLGDGEVLVQLVERRLREADVAEIVIDALQGRKQPDRGEGVDREDRHHAPERAVAGDQQIEDEDDQPAEADRLDDVARHLADDQADRVVAGDLPGRPAEAVGEIVLQAEELHVLHAAEGFADDAEALCIELMPLPPDPGELLAHGEIEHGIGAADHPGGGQCHARPHRDEQADEGDHGDEGGDELHRRQERGGHHLLHLAEHRRAQ